MTYRGFVRLYLFLFEVGATIGRPTKTKEPRTCNARPRRIFAFRVVRVLFSQDLL